MHNFVFWRRVFVDVYWQLDTFALSRCTCYVFVFQGAAYNVNLCNSPGSHMRNCNIFSCCKLLVHHSLGNCIQLWGPKIVLLLCYLVRLYSSIERFFQSLKKYPAHIILYMFQAIYQCRGGVGSNYYYYLTPKIP